MNPFSSFSSASYSSSSSVPPLVCEVNLSSIISANGLQIPTPFKDKSKPFNVLFLDLTLNDESDMESPKYVCPFYYDFDGNIVLDFFDGTPITKTDEFVDHCVRTRLKPHISITEDITHFVCSEISRFVGSTMLDVGDKPETSQGYHLSVLAIIETWEQ